MPRAAELGQQGWRLDPSGHLVLLSGDWMPGPSERIELRYPAK